MAYRNRLRSYLDRCVDAGVNQVVLIKILDAGEKYETKNPAVQSSIDEYNTILETICQRYDIAETVSPLQDSSKETVDRLTLSDGYHLNPQGHRYCSEAILDSLDVELRD